MLIAWTEDPSNSEYLHKQTPNNAQRKSGESTVESNVKQTQSKCDANNILLTILTVERREEK